MKTNKGILFILAAASLWGMAGIFVKPMIAAGVDEMTIVFSRALFSFLFLGLIILFVDKKLFTIHFRDIGYFVSTGIFSIVMFNFCYYRTMDLSSLSVAAVLLYTAPFFVVLLSIFVFKEMLTVKKCIACICAFCGCVLVSGIIGDGTPISVECLIFGLLTGFGYSLYTIFGNILLKKGYRSFTITFYTFLFAFIGTLPLVDFKNILSSVFSLNYIPHFTETIKATLPFAGVLTVIVAILMALFNTVLPYILYTGGLKSVSAGSAPIIATVEPVVATLVGALIFKEELSLAGIIGIILVLGSVIILNIGEKGNEN
ncbi:MAG: EamA family transporter [Ruminococcaceae bacterium]|nr:EamA family transporter [Oscillospiraceae bacterium]